MRALIGHTGFVGGNLLRQARFDDCFRSTDIASIRGRAYDLVVCAGAPAEKWRANREPEDDRRNLARLADCLAGARADRVVLISTVDVFADSVGADEDTAVDPARATAYGRHRFELEEFVRARFDTLVVRLPGLFGPGLKKNVVFDFLHGNQLDRIDARAVFQFYDVSDLWRDVGTALRAGLDLVHFAAEPVSVAEVAREAFGFEFANATPGVPARYDFRTRHAEVFGGRGGYLSERPAVLRALRQFVAGHRGRRCA